MKIRVNEEQDMRKKKQKNRPVLTTGQLFLHSWRHFLGLHLSELTMAIRVNRSAIDLCLCQNLLSLCDWMLSEFRILFETNSITPCLKMDFRWTTPLCVSRCQVLTLTAYNTNLILHEITNLP